MVNTLSDMLTIAIIFSLAVCLFLLAVFVFSELIADYFGWDAELRYWELTGTLEPPGELSSHERFSYRYSRHR